MKDITKNEILTSMEVALNTNIWEIPNDYKDTNVSQKIVKLLLRHI